MIKRRHHASNDDLPESGRQPGKGTKPVPRVPLSQVGQKLLNLSRFPRVSALCNQLLYNIRYCSESQTYVLRYSSVKQNTCFLCENYFLFRLTYTYE